MSGQISVLPTLAWFGVGTGLSLAHLAILARFVGRLEGLPGLAAGSRTVSGYLARYVSLLVVLLLAFRAGAATGIAVVAGYWIARWLSVWVWMRTGLRGPDLA